MFKNYFYKILISDIIERRFPVAVVYVLNCDFVVSKILLQSHCYVHFPTNTLRKGMFSLILKVMDYIVTLLFFNHKKLWH